VEEDVEFSDVVLGANLLLPPHRHERAQIVVVLEGLYREFDGTGTGEERRLAPGSVVLRAPGTLHSNRIGAREARALLLDFGPGRFPMLYDAASAGRTAYGSDFVLAEIAREIARELPARDPEASATIEALVRILGVRLGYLLRQPVRNGPPAWFLAALAVAEDPGGRVARVSRLASRAGVHPATLREAFRRYAGLSPKAFLLAVRLRRVARRLEESHASIGEIAIDEEFCDQAHLGRHFKRLYGMTPAAYRRAKRGRGSAIPTNGRSVRPRPNG